jgi:scyllo-inositol 2-dehydrogenase (NADP+)
MKRIRTGLIGLGRIGWLYHLPELIKHNKFELTAVMDPLRERVVEAQNSYGMRGYNDLNSFYSSNRFDLVVIASPTPFHAEQVLQAFERGCDVFCEKPFTVSFADAERIVNAMHKLGRKLMVYQPHRVYPEFASLQGILNKGLIGRVYMIKRTCSSFDRRNDWQAFTEYGGGMLFNYGAHYIDQVLTLVKSKVVDIHCSLFKIASLGDAEDVVKIVLRTENKVLLDLDINMATAFHFSPWYVLGTAGSITYDETLRQWHVRYFDPEMLAAKDVHSELAAPDRMYTDAREIVWKSECVAVKEDETVNFYDHCYDYFALGRKPFVPVSETLEIMRILEYCKRNGGYTTSVFDTENCKHA